MSLILTTYSPNSNSFTKPCTKAAQASVNNVLAFSLLIAILQVERNTV